MTDTTPDPVGDALGEVTREELRDIGRRHRSGLAELAAAMYPGMSGATPAADPTPEARPGYRNVDTQLAAFQRELPQIAATAEGKIPGKDGKAGFSYRYAELDAVSHATLPLLAKHGLAWSCTLEITERGAYVLVGRLVHGESGTQTVSHWKVDGGTAQAVGGSITYGRRYLLQVATGVAPGGEDDDGARAEELAAEERMERRRQEALARAERPAARPAPAAQGRPAGNVSAGSPGTGPARAAVARAVTEGGNLGNGQRTGNPDPLPVPEDRGEATTDQRDGPHPGRELREAVDQAYIDDRYAILAGTVDEPTAALLPAASAYRELTERDATSLTFSASPRIPEDAHGLSPTEVYMLRMHQAIKAARTRDTVANIAAAAKEAGVFGRLSDPLNARWAELTPRPGDES